MPTYGSHSGTTYDSRANTTITAPSGIADGDELLLYFILANATQAGIPAPTWPSGFSIIEGPTTVNEANNTGLFSVRSWLLRKRAQSESGDYQTLHSTTTSDGLIVRVPGGANAAHDATSNDGDGTGNITFTGLTTLGADAWIGAFCHNWNLWGSGTAPNGTTPTFTIRQNVATSLIHFSEGTWAGLGATGSPTKDSDNLNANDQWASMLVAIEMSGVPFTQYGSLGRNDDGSETTATSKAAQDAPFTIEPDVPFRLRMGVDTSGNTASQQYKLQYRKVGDASWRDIDTQG